jgi:hypothetical protein
MSSIKSKLKDPAFWSGVVTGAVIGFLFVFLA